MHSSGQIWVDWKLSWSAKPPLIHIKSEQLRGCKNPVFEAPYAHQNFWRFILSAQKLQCSCNIDILWKKCKDLHRSSAQRFPKDCIAATSHYEFIMLLTFNFFPKKRQWFHCKCNKLTLSVKKLSCFFFLINHNAEIHYNWENNVNLVQQKNPFSITVTLI